MSAPYSKSLKTRIPLFERMLIESQSNCNRSCWFCPRTYDRSGKYLDEVGKPVLNQMPTEKILDLLYQALPALRKRGYEYIVIESYTHTSLPDVARLNS